jgi:hypothetical protein
MDISGTLYKKMPVQTGVGKTGNTWSKMDFVIDFQDEMGNYKKLCLNAWGERVALLERINIGERLNIQFDVASREYNERWYTDLTARRIDVVGDGQPISGQALYQQPLSAPASMASTQATSTPPPPQDISESGGFSDDLPF